MKKTTLIIAGVVCICVLLKNIKIEVSCKNIYLISVEEFIELYGFTEEEIAEYDIQEFIEAKGFSVQRYIDRDYDNFNIEESEKKDMLYTIKFFFMEDSWRYATLTPGARKEFMDYDNIKYVVLVCESNNYHDCYEYVYNIEKNEFDFYEMTYHVADAYIHEDKTEEVIEMLKDANVLDFPVYNVFDEGEKAYFYRLALIYDNREHVCFYWWSDFHREDYGEYKIAELLEVLYNPVCVLE